MKKLLIFLTFIFALLLCFASCMHEHNFSDWTVTENATCTKDGIRCKICTDCGEVFDERVIPAFGHTERSGWITVEKATCTNQGIETKNCEDCGMVLNTRYTDVLGHAIVTKTKVLENPTCTETGTAEVTEYCKICDCVETVYSYVLPANGHDKRTFSEKDDNCFAYNITVCNSCDFIDFVITGVANHAFGDWERVDDNTTGSPCGIDKIYKRTCADCGVTEDRVDPTPDHNYIVTVISTHGFDSILGEATIGKIEYACQNIGCDSIYYEYEHHQYTKTVIAPTCTEQGYTLNSCACGLCYQSDFTEKLPHTPGLDATCTIAQTCTKCPEILTSALGHDWKEATCTTPKTCERCGVTEGKAKGHTPGAEATCTTPQICNECGTTIVSAVGHNYVNDVCDGCGDKLVFAAGLYDVDNNLVATWEELVNNYGLNVEKDYTYNNCRTTSSSPYYVLKNNSELSKGVKLIIDSGVTCIGEYAFYDCSSLTSVVVGSDVTNVGTYAFKSCESLTSVVIGNGVANIEDYVFEWCSSLKCVVIGCNVTYIGERAFYRCDLLESIIVNEGNSAYESLDGNLYNKEYTTLIQYAVGKSDKSFVVPDGVTSIAYYAFGYCKSLTSVVIPDTVTDIGATAFYSCTSLTNIKIGSSVTSIGEAAFHSCTSLKTIVIPDSVKTIGEYAINSCSALESVVIGSGITSIEKHAFSNCTSLTDVYYTASENRWSKIIIDTDDGSLTTATIHYNYVPEE